ncbi:MAG: hypothetical protein ABSA50_03855 [Candidatus Bathyarchaeia archaeon]
MSNVRPWQDEQEGVLAGNEDLGKEGLILEEKRSGPSGNIRGARVSQSANGYAD